MLFIYYNLLLYSNHLQQRTFCGNNRRQQLGNRQITVWVVSAVIAVSTLYCGHGNIVNSGAVREDITLTMNSLNRSALTIRNLNRKRVGKSGYYYIVDAAGTIVSHPQSAMAGFRLGENPFIQYIVRHKSGCVVQTIEGRTRIILFRTLRNDAILCLTIPAGEVSPDMLQSCEEFR